jgi:hypothetical protein
MKQRIFTALVGISLVIAWLGAAAVPAQADDFEEYLKDIYQYFFTYVGDTGVPDFLQVFFEAMADEMPEEGETASETENGSKDSYAIKEDVADGQEREGVLAYLNSNNLSQEAQELTAQTRQQSVDAVEVSQQLAANSQSLDTSQQILQNISAQLGQQALIAHLGFQEISKTREELAMSAVLLAQSAKELNQSTIAQRQDLAASHNQSILAAGLFSMPVVPVVEPE